MFSINDHQYGWSAYHRIKIIYFLKGVLNICYKVYESALRIELSFRNGKSIEIVRNRRRKENFHLFSAVSIKGGRNAWNENLEDADYSQLYMNHIKQTDSRWIAAQMLACWWNFYFHTFICNTVRIFLDIFIIHRPICLNLFTYLFPYFRTESRSEGFL